MVYSLLFPLFSTICDFHFFHLIFDVASIFIWCSLFVYISSNTLTLFCLRHVLMLMSPIGTKGGGFFVPKRCTYQSTYRFCWLIFQTIPTIPDHSSGTLGKYSRGRAIYRRPYTTVILRSFVWPPGKFPNIEKRTSSGCQQRQQWSIALNTVHTW